LNDFINQKKQSEVVDPTGLYQVLKEIQSKECPCDYICIEVGTIYGDFDGLRPRNSTETIIEKEEVKLVIKPVIIVNKTQEVPPKEKEHIKVITNGTLTPLKLFEDDDCEGDFISSSNKHNYLQNLRFKEKIDSTKTLQVVKRKFYRKVQFGSLILATQIFRQGLNVILLERAKGYKKCISF